MPSLLEEGEQRISACCVSFALKSRESKRNCAAVCRRRIKSCNVNDSGRIATIRCFLVYGHAILCAKRGISAQSCGEMSALSVTAKY